MFKFKNLLIVLISISLIISCTTTEIEPENISCVGTTYFNILDNNRPEILTEDPSDKRDIMVKIWYPAIRDKASKPVHMWYFTQDHKLPAPDSPSNYPMILKTKSESYLNAEPQPGTYPVIMYSHGYNAQGASNQYLIEHLVNKGYIVVSVSHNHQASIMMQYDGTLSLYDHKERVNDFFLSEAADITGDKLNNEIFELKGKPLTEKQKNRVYKLMEWAAGDHIWIDYWMEDFNSVLKTIKKINLGDEAQLYNSVFDHEKFKGLFDLNKLLALGSSMGGIVSLDFSNKNDNCIGAVSLDAIHYSLSRDKKYQKPYLYFHTGGGPLPAAKIVLEKQTADTYLIGIDGTKHIDFTDGTYFMRDWFDTGTIDGSRMIELMNETIGLFFDSCIDSKNKEKLEEYISRQVEFSVLKK